MAEISKITLPNGITYDIKDTVARTNGKVSGVKGQSESSYRTGNVNLTADNIGAYESHQYERGTLDVGIRSLVNSARANRLVFLKASQIIIEKTIDGGTTWEDAGYTDSQKIGLFSENGYSVAIPLLNGQKSVLCGLRITITGMNYDVPSGTLETEKYSYWNANNVISRERYFNVREWWFWISANNDTIKPVIYCASGAKPDNWVTVFNKDFGMTGWSGSDWLKAGAGKTFGGSINQTGNYWNWRLEFYNRPTDANISTGTFISNTAQSINQIRCYGDNVWFAGNGGNLVLKDHLYSWDNSKRATFPEQVTAPNFNGKINNHTVNSDVPANAKFTDTVTTVTTSGSGNAITDITASNGAITATKGSTFLTASSTLDATKLSGTIPTTCLPSYVDDVLEYTAKINFPTTGQQGKIYVDKTTNLTWRWSGSTYVEISPSLALGTTSSTAFRGDYGNTAYIHATDSGRLTTATVSGLYKVAATAHGHIASLTAVTKSDITDLGIPGDDLATQSSPGLMSANDKTIVNGISSTYTTKTQSSNHVIISKTQPVNQIEGDIWIVVTGSNSGEEPEPEPQPDLTAEYADYVAAYTALDGTTATEVTNIINTNNLSQNNGWYTDYVATFPALDGSTLTDNTNENNGG